MLALKQLDVYDASALKAYLEENKIDAVLHCAGEIVVSESIEIQVNTSLPMLLV